ncbi:MAG: DUF350 domain-containing protein [Bacteroidetes bacterium SW_9_63_38]|nr:MAG: DUF350 domain-containing protein [Bacteroidetes bacterium SW_9_63_38]
MDAVTELLRAVQSPVAFLALFAVLFVVGKWVNDALSSHSVDRQLTAEDNPALAISTAGYYLGIIIVYIGALLGPSTTLLWDLVLVGGYGLGGILLLLLSRVINDYLILRGFSAQRELIEDRNPGAGAVLFGSYVASAFIVAGSIHGEGGGPHTALAFYVLGQGALIAFTWLYDLSVPYSLLGQIEQDNVAAGVGFGGGLVAIGIIVMRAVSGDFVSWAVNLQSLGWNVLLVFVYLVGIRFFFDKVVIPRHDLNVEIAEDQNVGASLLEGAVSIGFATVLFFVL